MPKNIETTAFSHFFDDSTKISSAPEYLKKLKSHIILTLLVRDKVMVSDTQAVTSGNFRNLLRKDGVIRELLKKGYFKLAIRDRYDGEIVKSLNQLNRKFIANGNLDVGRKISNLKQDFFEKDDDISFFEQFSNCNEWKIDEISEIYTNKVMFYTMERLSSLVSAREIDIVKEEFAAEISQRRNGIKGLTGVFMYNVLPEKLYKRIGVPEFDLTTLLKECSDAAYQTALPSLMHLDTYFSDNHAKCFSLNCQRSPMWESIGETEILRIPTKSKFLVDSIADFDILDVVRLRDSRSSKRIRELVRNGVCTEYLIEEYKNNLEELYARIFETMVDKNPLTKSTISVSEDVRLSKRVYMIENSLGFLVEVLGLHFLFPGIGFAITSLFNRNIRKTLPSPEDKRAREMANWHLQQEKVNQHMENVGENKKIDFDTPALMNVVGNEVVSSPENVGVIS
ncbi:hypothetical protein [Cohaesibacter haloalkalitolerans]|uniref:hypothetical protein n=1 Tax=Cohaesibacter haloalkalitolerans TaxID=1162980 RepID=UPI0013C411B9|nr:hypothetical protein [Cohaesibacter haloalkalitolerans]